MLPFIILQIEAVDVNERATHSKNQSIPTNRTGCIKFCEIHFKFRYFSGCVYAAEVDKVFAATTDKIGLQISAMQPLVKC